MPPRFRQWFRRQYKNRPRPLAFFWEWSGRGKLKGRWKRSRAIKNIARHRANVAWTDYRRAHSRAMDARDKKNWPAFRHWKREWESAQARHRRWHRVQVVYKARQERQHRRWKRKRADDPNHRPEFQTWHLNGHSGNVDEALKPVIAWQVVVEKQVVTDTYDYSGHAPNSYHFPYADPSVPKQGHAIDTAGGDMCGAATRTRNEFGNAYFAELFSPCGWYIKYGTVYGGYFPGHGDHGHYATPR